MAETDTNKLNAPRDIAELVKPAENAYREDDTHRPSPFYQYGTLDTSGTGGAIDSRIEEVSPVFREARARNLITAARALDPDDLGVSAELVVLPEGSVTVSGSARSAEDARNDLQAALDQLKDNPVVIGGASATPGQQAAAQEADEDTDGPETNTRKTSTARKTS